MSLIRLEIIKLSYRMMTFVAMQKRRELLALGDSNKSEFFVLGGTIYEKSSYNIKYKIEVIHRKKIIKI